MHVDANDIFPKSAKDNLIYRLDNACAVEDGDTEGLISEKAAVKEYVQLFFECLLPGKSTTVTYHEIGKDQYYKPPFQPKEYDSFLQQYFIHDGMLMCYPITHGCNLVFYAFTHRHGSSLAVEKFVNGNVRTRNDYDRHFFAFSNAC